MSLVYHPRYPGVHAGLSPVLGPDFIVFLQRITRKGWVGLESTDVTQSIHPVLIRRSMTLNEA